MIKIHLIDVPEGARYWRVYLAWHSFPLSETNGASVSDAVDTNYGPVAYPKRITLPNPSDYPGVFEVITADIQNGDVWFQQNIVLRDGAEYNCSIVKNTLYELIPEVAIVTPTPEVAIVTPTPAEAQPPKWGWLVLLALLAFILGGKK